MLKKVYTFFLLLSSFIFGKAQQPNLAPTPPMGFMTWNYFADQITEADVKNIADAMVVNGLVDAGYNYIFIDDGWQGGRDNRNNIIPDAKKFPSGIKSLADYVHSKGLKLGIYSDAAPLTCAGYTASLHFEKQDAATFAAWGIDYLKYDYCGAPVDRATAEKRYKTMSDALRNSGRKIALGICEWGERHPWLWANKYGVLWRTTGDIRDKWRALPATDDTVAIRRKGFGILDIVNINGSLDRYAGSGHWNDCDMLVVGLYGKKGPSGDLGGIGCTDIEYQSQMSLWCLMAAPLMISCDVRNMNEATKAILLDKDIIAIDQDELGVQARRIINKDGWQVFVKPLKGNAYAIGILNTADMERNFNLKLKDIGLEGRYKMTNLWTKGNTRGNTIKSKVAPHQTILLKINN